jgi:hypothetical protein
MNSKGFFMDLISDEFLGLFIFFLSLLAWGFVFGFVVGDVGYDLTGNSATYHHDLVLMNFIRSPIGDGTVGGLIVNAFQKNERKALETALDGMVQNVYGQSERVCWKLWHYRDGVKKQLVGIPCRKTEDIFEGDVIFLMPDGKKIPLEFTIPGYAQ